MSQSGSSQAHEGHHTKKGGNGQSCVLHGLQLRAEPVLAQVHILLEEKGHQTSYLRKRTSPLGSSSPMHSLFSSPISPHPHHQVSRPGSKRKQNKNLKKLHIAGLYYSCNIIIRLSPSKISVSQDRYIGVCVYIYIDHYLTYIYSETALFKWVDILITQGTPGFASSCSGPKEGTIQMKNACCHYSTHNPTIPPHKPKAIPFSGNGYIFPRLADASLQDLVS